ncbi:ATP-binding protein [Vibrio sp. TBV020]|uniref:hybrid sensor histidine kinase/response regulator n=1 Tax=Vibrio sp. TBV020 TaxID=3137398 RepID=UPI0038CD97E0
MPYFYRTVSLILLLLVSLTFTSKVLYAQSTEADSKSSTLTFGVVSNGNCENHACVLLTNTFFSIMNDYLHNIASAMNVEVELKPYPNIDQLLLAVEHQEVSGAVGFSQTKQRESRFLFSKPFFTSRIAVWYSDKSLVDSRPSDLSWSCVKGSSYCDQLEREGISKINYAIDLADAMKSMRDGKSNALIDSFVVLSTYLDQSNIIRGMIDTPDWVQGEKVGLITAKQNQWLVDQVNNVLSVEKSGRTLRSLVSNNRYHTIERRLARYLNTKDSDTPITYSTSATSYPFLFRNEKGDIDGFLFDFFELLKSRSGLRFEYVEPVETVNGNLSAFNSDLVPVAYVDTTLIPNWQLTNPFMTVNYVSLTKKGADSDDAGAMNTGILSGVDKKGLVHLVGWQDQQVSQYTEILSIVEDLKSGAIDVAYIPQEFAYTILLRNDADELEIGKRDVLKVNLALATKDNPALNSLLNSLFTSIDENELKKIMRGHRNINLVNGYTADKLWQMGIGAIAVLVFFALFTYFAISNLKLKVKLAESSANQREKEKEWFKSIISELDSWIFIHDKDNNLLLSNCNDYLNKRNLSDHDGADTSSCYLVDNATEVDEVLKGKVIADFHEVKDCNQNLVHVHRQRKAIRSLIANREYVLTVIDDITEQKQRETELISTRESAQQAVIAREQFLATMSHELRTPIAAIQGLLELACLRESHTGTTDLLVQAQKSTRHLNTLVDEVLDFSQLNAEQLILSPNKVNLLELLCESIRSHEQVAQAKGLLYRVEVNPLVSRYALIDDLRLVQILNNLLSNAIKFTASGFVKIEVNGTQSDLRITISDTGIGMSKEQLTKVLKPFTQADAGVTRQYGGSGLGLSIVDKLVTCMQGTMTVESIPNVGSVFSLTIPFDSAEPEDGEISQLTYSEELPIALKQWCRVWGMSVGSKHTNVSLSGEDRIAISVQGQAVEMLSVEECRYPDIIQKHLIQSRVETNESTETHSLVGKVLVAEDNEINQNIIKMQLDEFGVQYHIVGNGKEAFNCLKSSQNISVVLTDFHMPEMDGFELTRLIKSSPTYRHLPVIGITAEDARVASKLGEESGVDTVLCKPYSIEVLHTILKEYLTEAPSI